MCDLYSKEHRDSLLLAYNAFHCIESMPPQEDIHIPHLSMLSVSWRKGSLPEAHHDFQPHEHESSSTSSTGGSGEGANGYGRWIADGFVLDTFKQTQQHVETRAHERVSKTKTPTDLSMGRDKRSQTLQQEAACSIIQKVRTADMRYNTANVDPDECAGRDQHGLCLGDTRSELALVCGSLYVKSFSSLDLVKPAKEALGWTQDAGFDGGRAERGRGGKEMEWGWGVKEHGLGAVGRSVDCKSVGKQMNKEETMSRHKNGDSFDFSKLDGFEYMKKKIARHLRDSLLEGLAKEDVDKNAPFNFILDNFKDFKINHCHIGVTTEYSGLHVGKLWEKVSGDATDPITRKRVLPMVRTMQCVKENGTHRDKFQTLGIIHEVYNLVLIGFQTAINADPDLVAYLSQYINNMSTFIEENQHDFSGDLLEIDHKKRQLAKGLSLWSRDRPGSDTWECGTKRGILRSDKMLLTEYSLPVSELRRDPIIPMDKGFTFSEEDKVNLRLLQALGATLQEAECLYMKHNRDYAEAASGLWD